MAVRLPCFMWHLHTRVYDCMMSGVILPAVSIRHSVILVTLTSAMVGVGCDMVVWATGFVAQFLWWCVVVMGALLSVDELVSENTDGEGSSGARQGSTQLHHVIGRVTSLVGFPESCKSHLMLLVRSGVRVEG